MGLLGIPSSRYVPCSRYDAILCIKPDDQYLAAWPVCWCKEKLQRASRVAFCVIALAAHGPSEFCSEIAFGNALQWRKIIRLCDPYARSPWRLRELHKVAESLNQRLLLR